jgi:hypothetical protein
VALVMAGSTQMYTKVTERDSPLENILDRYLLPTLSREATLALARQPGGDRRAAELAEEVWRQTGGQPCMVQYLLHELWAESRGALEDCSSRDVQDVAATFEARTGHCSEWTRTLGPMGHDLYRTLVEQDGPATYAALRQRFPRVDVTVFQSTLDALLYHGLIHSHGRGRRSRYEVAGRIYRDWFTSAGRIDPASEPGSEPEPPVQVNLGKLRLLLIEHFDERELRSLSFDLGVDYQTLGGEGKEDKARELIAHLNRRNRASELVEWGRQLRPDVPWGDVLRAG